VRGLSRAYTLFELDGYFVVDSHITILRTNPQKAVSRYVLYCLAAIGFKNIEALAQGQSGQIELSLPIIGNIKIPLPPLSEQRKIVAKIEHLEAEITALQTATFSPQKNAVLEKYLAATVR
jgi:restriction endonuclease S subunit